MSFGGSPLGSLDSGAQVSLVIEGISRWTRDNVDGAVFRTFHDDIGAFGDRVGAVGHADTAGVVQLAGWTAAALALVEL